MASDQQVKLNLVITAEDQAQSVIKDFVASVEGSFKSLQDTLKSLNDFKFKNPISKSVVASIKASVVEINTAIDSIGKGGTTSNAASPLDAEAKTIATNSNAIIESARAIPPAITTAHQALTTTVKPTLLSGVVGHVNNVKTSINELSGKVASDTKSIEGSVRSWSKTFGGVVIDVEQDVDGVYKVVGDMNTRVKDATSWFDKLKTAVSSVGSAFKSMADGVASSMSGFTTKVDGDVKTVDNSLNNVRKSAQSTQDSLRKAFDFAQLQFAGQQIQQWGHNITGFVGKMVTSAANFNQSVMNVAGSLRAQGESAKQVNAQLQSMNGYALQLGSQGYFSANQVADAMNVMAKQGISYKTIMGGALKAAHDVAAANQEDLSQTSNVISDIVHEMGGSLVQQYGNIGSAMGHVGDQMTVALHHSRISMTDFLNSMKYAGPQASNLGVHFSDLAGAIAELGQHGIRGSQAGTTLRRALQELAAPTSTSLKEMQALGLATANGTTAFTDATGKLKPLADVQQILYQRLQQLNPAQREQALQSMFSMYAVSGMTAIVNTAPASFQSMMNAMQKSGTAQSILAEKSQGVGFQIQHMQAQWATLIKQLGELFLPAATSVIGALTHMMSAIQSFTSQHPQLVKIIAVFSALFGVLMVGGGTVAVFIGTVGMLKNAVVDLVPALASADIAFGPILLVIGAVALAAAGLYLAWKNNLFNIQGVTKEAIQGVVAWFHKISPELTQLKNEIGAVIKFLDPVWKAFWTGFQAIARGAFTALEGIFKGAWKIIEGIVQLFLDFFTGHWGKLWSDVKLIFQGFVTAFMGIFKGYTQAFEGVLKAYVTMVGGVWKNLWALIRKLATDAWSFLKSHFSTEIKAIETLWNDFTSMLRHVFAAFADLFKGDVRGFFTNIVQAFQGYGKVVLDEFNAVIWQPINDLLGGLPAKALQWGENLIGMFIQGIQNKIADVGKMVSNVANTVKSFLGFHSPTEQGPASDSDTWMPNMMKMFTQGVQQQLPTLKASLGVVASTIQQTVAPGGVAGGITNVSNVVNHAPMYAPSNRTSGGVVIQNLNVTAPKGANAQQLGEAIAKAIRQQMPVVSA